MTALAQALSAALLHFVWQGSLVAVMLWATLFGWRKRPAAWRYGASCAALAIQAALPLLTVWILLRDAAPAAAVVPAPPVYVAAAARAGRPAALAVSWLVRVENWALPVWSLGVLFLSIRLAWGAGQLYRLRRRGEAVGGAVAATVDALAARMGIRRPVAVWMSALADGPSVVGWIRPLVLLPSGAMLGLTTEQLEAVLAHELAHIRRYDYAVNLVQMLIETLLFYHPAVWWVSARIRHERELCCDDLAVESCGNALCYARALTRLERLRLTAPGMAMSATGSPLLYRIQRLMGAGAEYRPSRLPAVLAIMVGVGCLALNVHWAKAQEAPKPQQQEPASVTVKKDGQTVTVTLRNGVKSEDEPQPVDLYMAADQGRTATLTLRSDEQGVEGVLVSEHRRDQGVQIDTGGAQIVKREPIEYPGQAIERNIQGVVTVEAIQDANGDVTDAHVLAGPQELRKAALQSVLEWRFQPAAAGTARQVNITFQIPPGGFPKEPEQGYVMLRGPNVGLARSREYEQAQQTVSFLEEEISKIKERHQGQLPEGASPEIQAQYNEFLSRLEQARLARREAERTAAQGQDSAEPAIGRIVESIRTRGLEEGRGTELQARLPIHIGDTLTAQSVEQLETAVRQFDERLAVAYALQEGGKVGIRIVRVNVEGEIPVQYRMRK